MPSKNEIFLDNPSNEFEMPMAEFAKI